MTVSLESSRRRRAALVALGCSSLLIAACSTSTASSKVAVFGSTTVAPATTPANTPANTAPKTSVPKPSVPPGLGGDDGGDDDGGGGDDGGRRGPGGDGPGQGTPVLGDAYNKAVAAAVAKYPGTIQTVEQLADGTIMVHVILADGREVHVRESSDYKVTGVDQGPGGRPPGSPTTTSN